MPATTGSTVNIKLLIQAVDRASKVVDSLRGQLNEISKSAIGFSKESSKASQKAVDGLEQVAEEATRSKNSLDGITSALESFGALSLKLSGLAATLSAPFIAATISASGFEQSMSQVLAVTAGAADNFDALNQKAAELGRTTKFTANEAAQGMVFLGQAGLEATEVVEGITPALTLATAAGIGLAESADIATNIVSAMRLPVDELAGAVDILANTAASANTNIVQLADAFTYAGPLAAAAGVELEEAAAIVGVLGNNGIQASMAGTALRGMLFALSAPTERARSAMDRLGVTVEIAADGSIDLIDALHQLADAQITAADANAIFGRYAAAGALAVTANVKELDKMVRSNYNAAGAAEEMAKIMKTNLRGSFIALTSAINGFINRIGAPLLKPITSILNAVSDVVNFVTDLMDRLPVLTNLIVYATAAIAALATAMAGAAVAAAGLHGVLALLNVQLGGYTILNLMKGSFASLSATVLSTSGLLASLTGLLKGLWAAVKVLVGWLGKLVVWLSRLNIVAQIAIAVGLLVYAMAEWGERTKRLIRENAQLSASLNAVNTSIQSHMDRLEELEEGSEDYKDATKVLREELIKVSEEHDELEEKAREAADSINELTGEIIDGGAALREFKEAAEDLQLEKIKNQGELLNEELKKLTGQAGFLNGAFFAMGMTAKTMWALVTDGADGVKEVFRELEKEIEKNEARVKAVGESYLHFMGQFQELDLSASREEIYFYLTEVQNVSEDLARVWTERHEEMQSATGSVARSISELEAMSLEDLRSATRDTVKDVQDLGDAYEEAARKAKAAVVEFNKVGGTDAKQAAEEAIDIRTRVYNERIEKEKELDNFLKVRRREEINELKEKHDEELEELERRKELRIISEQEYNIESKKIDKDFALRRNEVYSNLLAIAINSNAENLESYNQLVKDLKRLDKEIVDSYQAVTDEKIKLANEQKDYIESTIREARRIEISLMSEGTDKIKAQYEEEVKLVKDKAEKQLIEESRLKKLLAALHRQYLKEIEDYNREVRVARLEAEDDLAEQRAEISQKRLDDQLQYGRISVTDYVQETTRLQTEAIDREIAILQEKLSAFKGDLENNPVVVEIKSKIEGLEESKEDIVSEVPQRIAQLTSDRTIMEIEKEQQLHQLKMDNMRTYNSTLEELNEAQLQALDLQHDKEIALAWEKYQDLEMIEKMHAEHRKERRQTEAELDKQAFITRIGWASQMAGEVEGFFADMYEAGGKKRKEWLYAEKAAAIATTLMNSHAAAMKAMVEPGGIMGKVLAALIIARGIASAAKIAATPIQAAEGGEIKGSSPHDKADNIPTLLTAKEWVMPVKAVKKYGKSVMAGIQKGLFPEELFRGWSFPVPAPHYSHGYASGGQVMSKKDSVAVNPQQQVVTPPPQPITIMNVTDPTELDRYMSTSAGQNAVLNVLSTRAEAVRRIIK